MKLTLNHVFFVLFVSVWALLIIGNFLIPEKNYSESENRVLASVPDFSTETLLNGEYMRKLEEYTNDQFLMRDKWITLKNLTEQAMLKTDSNGVYFARDGYLIQKHDTPDEERAEKNKAALASFVSRTTTKLGSDRVRVMLVPTAFEILEEKLPAFACGFDQLAYNASVAENLPQDVFLDVSGALEEHSNEYIYYRTDHHWTTLGAYYAYEVWAQDMGFEPLSQEDFEIVPATENFYGTLHSKVNLPVKPDTMYIYERKGNPTYRLTYNMAEERTGLYQWEALDSKDKYSIYLGGNYGLVKIETENENGRRLLVLKDSYAHSFIPFAVEHYTEIHMIDLRMFNMDLDDYMETNGITDVLVLYNTINFAEDLNLIKITADQSTNQ